MAKFVQLLRIAAVSKKTTLAESTLWWKISRDEFIAPTRIGGICVWKESDVDDWIESHFQPKQEVAA
jgi:predicted DNA-binding transcriptional regulator AlpA